MVAAKRRVWLRRIAWAVGGLAFVGVLVAGAAAVYVARTWDRVWDVPLPKIHASTDPEVIRRGESLVFGAAHCIECHGPTSEALAESERNGRRPPLTGGMRFAAPPLGSVYSKNLTPDEETGIGRYSDPQLARMLRHSVRPDGRASVRLLMPFGNMSDGDVMAILSYLRSQPPVRHVVPENEWTLVGKIVKSFSPVFQPRENVDAPAVSPAEAPTRERGEYLARGVANCVGCHTKYDDVTLKAVRPEFSGGGEMGPAMRPDVNRSVWFRVPNITPAPGSALSKFPDRETFVARFQRGGLHYPGSPMPWECFGRMSAEDIGALYEFLHSLPPQHGPTGAPTFVKGTSPTEVSREAARQ